MASMKDEMRVGPFRCGVFFGFILSLAALRPDPAVVVVFAPEAIADCSFKQATKLVKALFHIDYSFRTRIFHVGSVFPNVKLAFHLRASPASTKKSPEISPRVPSPILVTLAPRIISFASQPDIEW